MEAHLDGSGNIDATDEMCSSADRITVFETGDNSPDNHEHIATLRDYNRKEALESGLCFCSEEEGK